MCNSLRTGITGSAIRWKNTFFLSNEQAPATRAHGGTQVPGAIVPVPAYFILRSGNPAGVTRLKKAAHHFYPDDIRSLISFQISLSGPEMSPYAMIPQRLKLK